MVRITGLVVVVALVACPKPAPDHGKKHPADKPPGECAADTNKPIPAGAAAIYDGTRRPSLMPLDAAQQDAVVGVTDEVTLPDGTFCSGTLIADDIVMTAQHCTAGGADDAFLVVFGPDDFNPKLVIQSLEVHEHPYYDLAIIKLTEKPGDTIAVTPILPALAPPPDSQIGSLVENAGYGQTNDGSHGRYFVTELYVGIDGDFFGVDGQGQRGVCFGDSGGPMLHVSAAGDVRVLGALSFGLGDECGQQDFYQRSDIAVDFIEPLMGPIPPGGPEPCGADVTDEGRCTAEQGLAEYCDGGVIVRDACGAGEICASTPEGNRCVPVEDNACGAVTTYGSCDGETLTWCDDGNVKTRDCSACGEKCLRGFGTPGFACIASDCGDIDEDGVCEGTVSKWCDVVSLQVDDCADYDATCEYIGPENGYYCTDPVACEGLNYAGECDGAVVRWCEDYVVLEYDCAADGQTCGFVEDEDGYNCQ